MRHHTTTDASSSRPSAGRAWYRILRVGVVSLIFACLCASCASSDVRRFPNADAMWEDPDREPFRPAPESYYSPFGWDAVDQTIFRPFARLWLFLPDTPAVNVNAMDEVPNSSWFENRIGTRPMTPAEIARGPCETELTAEGPWVVSGAKPDGANPGFVMKAQNGKRYLVKFDGVEQPERATAADVIGSKMYWAVGYRAPCNQIVFFEPDILDIDPEATAEREDGTETPLTWKDIETVLSKAYQREDGRYRASTSEFLPGKPLGPWRYQSTRSDDPNDVIDHEDRRELRGMYVLASWLNHFDSREQNTLSMWITPEDGSKAGYVRHNMIDFGDGFGSLWAWDGISRRLGHAHYLDLGHLFVDLLTFGFMQRPWDDATYGPSGTVFAYYSVERFVPDEWKPGYPNPAFSEMQEADAAWMARKLALFDDDVVDALVAQAKFESDDVSRELRRLLIGRRDKILHRWLVESPLSPLTRPRVRPSDIGPTELCLEDRAVQGGAVLTSTREYRARAWDDDVEPMLGPEVRVVRSGHICMALPTQPEATVDQPRYLIVEVFAQSPRAASHAPLVVHLWQNGDDFRVAGLERPEASDPPE